MHTRLLLVGGTLLLSLLILHERAWAAPVVVSRVEVATKIIKPKPKPKPKPVVCKAGKSCKNNFFSCPAGTHCSGMPVYRCYPIGCPYPICLPSTAFIDTPAGRRLVTSLNEGDVVWTLNAEGKKVAAPLVQVSSVSFTEPHGMVHARLSDGRVFTMSAGHPLVDGRRADALVPGEAYAGSSIYSVEMVPYSGNRTYDILPGGTTGQYFLEGVPVGSTLKN